MSQDELLVPFECNRCGAVKRDEAGRVERVPLSVWLRYRPQLCPTCFAAVSEVMWLRRLVLGNWEDDDQDV